MSVCGFFDFFNFFLKMFLKMFLFIFIFLKFFEKKVPRVRCVTRGIVSATWHCNATCQHHYQIQLY